MRHYGEDKHPNFFTLLVSFVITVRNVTSLVSLIQCDNTIFFVLLSLSSGSGQTNLWMPQGVLGQVMIGSDGYIIRWDHSYSSWTLFTCEVEMLLHVVSTAGTQLTNYVLTVYR